MVVVFGMFWEYLSLGADDMEGAAVLQKEYGIM